jgi:hypothetical protein
MNKRQKFFFFFLFFTASCFDHIVQAAGQKFFGMLSTERTVKLGQCGRNHDDVNLTSGLQNNRFSGNVVTILLHPKPSYWLETP